MQRFFYTATIRKMVIPKVGKPDKINIAESALNQAMSDAHPLASLLLCLFAQMQIVCARNSLHWQWHPCAQLSALEP